MNKIIPDGGLHILVITRIVYGTLPGACFSIIFSTAPIENE